MGKTSGFWILIIAFFGAALYLQTIPYGYSGDDGIYSYFNWATQKGLGAWDELFKNGSMNFLSIEPVNSGIYRPFALLTFALEYEIFGEFEASNGHLINVILYFLFLLILGVFLGRICKLGKLEEWIPLLALLLFAAHPIHTEVVASVKSRDSLLAALFGFSALVSWLNAEDKRKPKLKVLAGGLFFLAVLSKEESLPLLAIPGFISWFFLDKKPTDSLMATLPFLIPSLVYVIIRSLVLDPSSSIYDTYINSVLYGADSGQRMATNFYMYLKYLKLLVFPHPLSWDYSFSQITVKSFGNPSVIFSIVLFGFLLYVVFRGLKTKSNLAFWLIFYLVCFSIFANLTSSLTIGSNLGERFLFVPSIAFCVLLVLGLSNLLRSVPWRKRSWTALAILAPVVIAYSWKTWDRSKVWENNMTLSRSGTKDAPNSWRTHVMYAEELRLAGKKLETTFPDSAKSYFADAIREYDATFAILGSKNPVPRYLSTLGEALIGYGDKKRAEEVFKKSTEVAPKVYFAWFKLGMIYFERGEYEDSKKMYLKALEGDRPDLFATYKNLGLCYLRLKQYPEAILAMENALSQKDETEVKNTLVFLYTQVGDAEKATQLSESDSLEADVGEITFQMAMAAGTEAFNKKDYSEAIRNFSLAAPQFDQYGGNEKYPKYHLAFGRALLETRDTVAAKGEFLKAFAANQKDPLVSTNLGVIYFSKEKNFLKAEEYFRNAVQSDPEDPLTARVNLGSALLVQRKEKEAIAVLEDALKYGANQSIYQNLYLLHKSTGNREKMEYYQNLIKP